MNESYEHNNFMLKIPTDEIVAMKEYVLITDEREFLVKIQFQQKNAMQKTFPLKSYFLFINLEKLSPGFNFQLGK